MLEDAQTESAQVQGGKGGIKRPDEVFVEPLCLLDLEADPLDRLKLLGRQIDDEPDTQVIQPCTRTVLA